MLEIENHYIMFPTMLLHMLCLRHSIYIFNYISIIISYTIKLASEGQPPTYTFSLNESRTTKNHTSCLLLLRMLLKSSPHHPSYCASLLNPLIALTMADRIYK